MGKKNLLFVDDDPNILAGIRRILRSLRDDFDLHFAESGREALELMQQISFHAVISDMRMPGMDGAELLKRTQELYPCTIRIMLTGQADQDSILRTVGVAHQFLEKPSNPDMLKSILIRSSALYDLLANEEIKELVSRIESLPSLPDIYLRLQKAMLSSDVSVVEVATIIEQDIAMSAKVLQLVNSAFFGLFQQVESPARAVGLLGLETIKGLVLGVQVFSEMKSKSKLFSLNALMTHSMSVGAYAKAIAMAETDNKATIDHSFISGIMHDVGKLIFATKMHEQYDQVLLLAQEESLPEREAELRVFHTGHDNVGAYLLGLWGLPGPVVEAIAFHHSINNYPANSFSPALAVHVANTLYHENNPQGSPGSSTGLALDYIEKIGLSNRIEKWRELCRELDQQRKSL